MKMTEEPKYILYEQKDNVATITLNRPQSLNALNTTLLTELRKVLEDIETDPEVHVVVITGAGDKAFCAGADISEILDKAPEEARVWSWWVQGVLTRIETVKKPAIAKINGFCLGGGLELAMACDFRIASETAIFGLPEISLAIIPGGGGTQRLPRLIGKTKAMELLMTSEQIDAAEAYRLTLVNTVVPVDELDREVDELIKKLLSKSPATLGTLKYTVNKGMEMNLEYALEYESECFGVVLTTEDAREGLKAFLEKRKPNYKGR